MPKLVITEGPDAGRSFPLSGDEIIVGRGDAAAIQVSDLTVSREHFSLVPEGTGWKLLDRGSRNRTLVNGDPVLVHFLRDGDRIAVGSTHFAYVGEVSASTPVPNALDLLPTGFENVTVELRGLADIARGASRLAALYTFTEEVSRAERLDDLYPCITRLAREKCDADRAFLFVVDRSGELMTAARSSEDAAERVSVSRTVIDKVLQEGTSIVAADAYGDLRLQGKASIVDNAIRSVMCAPIVSRGRTIGILYVDIQRDGRHFEQEDLRFLSAIGQQAGIAIDNLILRDALMAENHALRSQVTQRHNLVGESPAIGAVLTFIGKVARTDSTVMLNGESGTGKELVARAIHAASPRANKPFVAVNCAALTESLLESELFGHEKGAFTGATAQAKGRFELADTGTLFLDEVGELSPNVQTKFLRVLEESCFQRVGGARQIH
ncbi:MAG: sigma 54-interacting transcriptional regulator, partial [Myxococcales bacterium]|nr:sigma 54-interacting transcriptional regulator [Myxococcales bacterium]